MDFPTVAFALVEVGVFTHYCYHILRPDERHGWIAELHVIGNQVGTAAHLCAIDHAAMIGDGVTGDIEAIDNALQNLQPVIRAARHRGVTCIRAHNAIVDVDLVRETTAHQRPVLAVEPLRVSIVIVDQRIANQHPVVTVDHSSSSQKAGTKPSVMVVVLSTTRAAPLTAMDSSDARNSTMFATSSGLPTHTRSMALAASGSFSRTTSCMASSMGVRMLPGWIELQRTP